MLCSPSILWIPCLLILGVSSQADILDLLLREPGNQSDNSLLSGQSHIGEHLMIGAFNIRMFGTKKASNADVMEILVKILKRYDLVLVQEIRDDSGEAIQQLFNMLNSDGPVYKMSLSERLGRSYSKEQYAYIYKAKRVELLVAEGYLDVGDEFEREPYVALLKYKDGSFGVIGIHTKPDAAESEIDAIVDVYNFYSLRWNIKDFLMMGDFNADCNYVTTSEWGSVRLWTDDRFVWLVDNNLDTTTITSTHCAYDRIVVAGNLMRQMVDPGSAASFKFDKEYELTKEQAFDVSDHYPVECKLYLKADEQSLKELEKIHFSQSVSVQNAQGPLFCPLADVQGVFEECASATGYTAILDVYKKNSEMYFSVSDIPEEHIEHVFSLLDCVLSSAQLCPEQRLLSQVSRDLLRINLEAGVFPLPQDFPEVRLSSGAFLLEVQFKINQNRMPYEIILTRKTIYQEEEVQHV